ncbi:hypothetical protein, partial [Brevibacillus reuszeri]|uniref:hypothetical protein n=1 Tax=Brevibacillus reuszeri TaxID=54915 RepID=UPI001BB40D2C
AASVRPEPGSNSPIKFVTGSKLANHLMIDSLTLSLFSFQRAFCFAPISEAQISMLLHPTVRVKYLLNKMFKLVSLYRYRLDS